MPSLTFEGGGGGARSSKRQVRGNFQTDKQKKPIGGGTRSSSKRGGFRALKKAGPYAYEAGGRGAGGGHCPPKFGQNSGENLGKARRKKIRPRPMCKISAKSPPLPPLTVRVPLSSGSGGGGAGGAHPPSDPNVEKGGLLIRLSLDLPRPNA